MAAFDTHKAVKALCSAGFDDAQAEAVVDQISGAIHENVATKTDIDKLATKDELRQAVAKLATKDELRQEVEKLATKDELRQEVEKLELRLAAELEKQSSKYLRSMVVVVAGIVGLSKALELLLA